MENAHGSDCDAAGYWGVGTAIEHAIGDESAARGSAGRRRTGHGSVADAMIDYASGCGSAGYGTSCPCPANASSVTQTIVCGETGSGSTSSSLRRL